MWGMDKDLTPLGELLESAREARRPKLSQNAVAKHAHTSPTTYRRVITGVARLGGRDVPFEGNDETIARIAHTLGVTPEQLEQVDRPEAAEELRLLAAGGVPTHEQRVPVGQAVETDTAGPVVRVRDTGLAVPSPPAEGEGDDPRMQRAAELLAEATALLNEIRRERREGA